MFEKMPNRPQQPERKIPPEELFGSNVFEVAEGGELKRVSEDIEKSSKKKIEIPEQIQEEAKKYAEAKAWFARDLKEAERIKEEAIKEYYKIKAKEIERIIKLKEKEKELKSKENKEEIIELTEEVK